MIIFIAGVIVYYEDLYCYMASQATYTNTHKSYDNHNRCEVSGKHKIKTIRSEYCTKIDLSILT